MSVAMLVIEIAAWVLALLLAIPVTVLLLQIVAARRAVAHMGAQIDGASSPRPGLAILMPAHDEADGIGAAIAQLLPQLASGDRLLVVADNCSDETARIAASLGAEVVERHDASRRGKGYALDHGVRHLARSPPAVVVIVDADCVVHPGALDRLSAACIATGRPTQALYLMLSPAGAALKTRIAEFAWTVRNRVRPLGCLRLGWPCQLMGTGMAFPWRLIEGASLASGHIVEDMQLGIELAAAGTPPLFCPDALVTSVFPMTTEAIEAQRTRWEHGHLGTIASSVPGMLTRALLERRGSLAAMALDLAVPPLSSLAMLLCVSLVLAAAALVSTGDPAPLLLAVTTGVAFVSAARLAWSAFGRNIVSARDWLAIPGYALSKIPMYAKLYSERQKQWVRTRRDRP